MQKEGIAMLYFDEKRKEYVEITGGLRLRGKFGKRIIDIIKYTPVSNHESLSASAKAFNDAVIRDGRLCRPKMV